MLVVGKTVLRKNRTWIFSDYLCPWYSLIRNRKWSTLVAQTVKNLPAMRRSEFSPWAGTFLWRREPTPVFLPGELHGQRCLAGYCLWDWKESDTTEKLSFQKVHILELTSPKIRENNHVNPMVDTMRTQYHLCGIFV